MDSELIKSSPAAGSVLLTLNRAAQRNALTDTLIVQLTQTLRMLEQDRSCRVVLLTGSGTAFCAGADLTAMCAVGQAPFADNLAQANQLSTLYHVLHGMKKPTIAVVNGPAVGGGVGLCAACDFAISTNLATFRLPEVRIGIVPAVIAPYVVTAMGARAAHWFMLSGEAITAQQAQQWGLVHAVVRAEGLLDEALLWAESLTLGRPQALASCKALLRSCTNMPITAELRDKCANLLAELRATDDAQDCLNKALQHHSSRGAS